MLLNIKDGKGHALKHVLGVIIYDHILGAACACSEFICFSLIRMNEGKPFSHTGRRE